MEKDKKKTELSNVTSITMGTQTKWLKYFFIAIINCPLSSIKYSQSLSILLDTDDYKTFKSDNKTETLASFYTKFKDDSSMIYALIEYPISCIKIGKSEQFSLLLAKLDKSVEFELVNKNALKILGSQKITAIEILLSKINPLLKNHVHKNAKQQSLFKIGLEEYYPNDYDNNYNDNYDSTSTTVNNFDNYENQQSEQESSPPPQLLLATIKRGSKIKILEVSIIKQQGGSPMTETQGGEATSMSFIQFLSKQAINSRNFYPTDVFTLEEIEYDVKNPWVLVNHSQDFSQVTLAGHIKSVNINRTRIPIDKYVKISVPTRFVNIILPKGVESSKYWNNSSNIGVDIKSCKIDDNVGKFKCNELISNMKNGEENIEFSDYLITPSETPKNVLIFLQKYAKNIATNNTERYLEETDLNISLDRARHNKKYGKHPIEFFKYYGNNNNNNNNDNNHLQYIGGFLYPNGHISLISREESRKNIVDSMINKNINFSEALKLINHREMIFTSKKGFKLYLKELVNLSKSKNMEDSMEFFGEYAKFKDITSNKIPGSIKKQIKLINGILDENNSILINPFKIDGLPNPDSDNIITKKLTTTTTSLPLKENDMWKNKQMIEYVNSVEKINTDIFDPVSIIFAVLFSLYEWGSSAKKISKIIVPHLKNSYGYGNQGIGDDFRKLYRSFKHRFIMKFLEKTKGMSNEEASNVLMNMSIKSLNKSAVENPTKTIAKLRSLTIEELSNLPIDLVLELSMLQILPQGTVKMLLSMNDITKEDILAYNKKRCKTESKLLFGLPSLLTKSKSNKYTQDLLNGKLQFNYNDPVTAKDLKLMKESIEKSEQMVKDDNPHINTNDNNIISLSSFISNCISNDEREALWYFKNKSQLIGIEPITIIAVTAAIIVGAALIGGAGKLLGELGIIVIPKIIDSWAKGSGGFGDTLRNKKRSLKRFAKTVYLDVIENKSDEEIKQQLSEDVLKQARNTTPEEAIYIIQHMDSDLLINLDEETLKKLIENQVLSQSQIDLLFLQKEPIITKNDIKDTSYDEEYVKKIRSMNKTELLDIPTSEQMKLIRHCTFTLDQISFLILSNKINNETGLKRSDLSGCYVLPHNKTQLDSLLKGDDEKQDNKESNDKNDNDNDNKTADLLDSISTSSKSLIGKIGISKKNSYIGIDSSSPDSISIFGNNNDDNNIYASLLPIDTNIENEFYDNAFKKLCDYGTGIPEIGAFIRDIEPITVIHPDYSQFIIDFGSLPGRNRDWDGVSQVFLRKTQRGIVFMRAYVFVSSKFGSAVCMLYPRYKPMFIDCSLKQNRGLEIRNLKYMGLYEEALPALFSTIRGTTGALCRERYESNGFYPLDYYPDNDNLYGNRDNLPNVFNFFTGFGFDNQYTNKSSSPSLNMRNNKFLRLKSNKSWKNIQAPPKNWSNRFSLTSSLNNNRRKTNNKPPYRSLEPHNNRKYKKPYILGGKAGITLSGSNRNFNKDRNPPIVYDRLQQTPYHEDSVLNKTDKEKDKHYIKDNSPKNLPRTNFRRNGRIITKPAVKEPQQSLLSLNTGLSSNVKIGALMGVTDCKDNIILSSHCDNNKYNTINIKWEYIQQRNDNNNNCCNSNAKKDKKICINTLNDLLSFLENYKRCSCKLRNETCCCKKRLIHNDPCELNFWKLCLYTTCCTRNWDMRCVFENMDYICNLSLNQILSFIYNPCRYNNTISLLNYPLKLPLYIARKIQWHSLKSQKVLFSYSKDPSIKVCSPIYHNSLKIYSNLTIPCGIYFSVFNTSLLSVAKNRCVSKLSKYISTLSNDSINKMKTLNRSHLACTNSKRIFILNNLINRIYSELKNNNNLRFSRNLCAHSYINIPCVPSCVPLITFYNLKCSLYSILNELVMENSKFLSSSFNNK